MYANQTVYEQVKKLFIEMPGCRDNRDKTIEYIVKTYYLNMFGVGIIYTFRLLANIDRAFREVQQDCPELRGKNWPWRQFISGEINKDELQAANGQLSFNFP